MNVYKQTIDKWAIPTQRQSSEALLLIHLTQKQYSNQDPPQFSPHSGKQAQ